MTDPNVILKKQLLFLLRGGNAHMPIKRAVKNFPLELINKTIENFNHSPWHLLEHLRLSQDDILNFINYAEYEAPEWPEGFWPALNKKADIKLWQTTVDQFFNGLDKMEKLIKDKKENLLKPITHQPSYTLFREAMVLADHNSYHLGQLLMIQKIFTK